MDKSRGEQTNILFGQIFFKQKKLETPYTVIIIN